MMLFFVYLYGDHRDLHVLTHSFPTRRSSDLDFEQAAHHAALAHVMLRQICAQIAHNAALLAQMKSRIALIDSPSQLHLIVKTSEDAPRMTEDRKGTRLNSSH